MVWVFPYLRQAVIQIDQVPGVELPMNIGDGVTWESIFKKVGWDVKIIKGKENIKESSDGRWSNAELIKMLKQAIEPGELDKEWRYHLAVVKNLDDMEALGIMYSNSLAETDFNRVGAAVAYEVAFPNGEIWGKCKGMRFGDCKAPYFRTAVHQIGHSMGLYHPDNPNENYIMQRTVNIAYNAHNAMPPLVFPDNIEWSFSPHDKYLLCHLPDIATRPGGLPFGTPYYRIPLMK